MSDRDIRQLQREVLRGDPEASLRLLGALRRLSPAERCSYSDHCWHTPEGRTLTDAQAGKHYPSTCCGCGLMSHRGYFAEGCRHGPELGRVAGYGYHPGGWRFMHGIFQLPSRPPFSMIELPDEPPPDDDPPDGIDGIDLGNVVWGPSWGSG